MIAVEPLEVPLASRGVSPGATDGHPEQFSATILAETGLRAVVWTCDPGDFPWKWENPEVFHIIEGAGTITDAAGRIEELRPGRLFVMSPGDEVVWHITETIRKVLVVPN
ncbi:cupin domain-containing protein [Mycetocola sp. 2940]|uniref:cupin domain-containing protein n=1 Tax=Mycetocola sp. 2940 TaxID=3156452 RepID=UPI0033927132